MMEMQAQWPVWNERSILWVQFQKPTSKSTCCIPPNLRTTIKTLCIYTNIHYQIKIELLIQKYGMFWRILVTQQSKF